MGERKRGKGPHSLVAEQSEAFQVFSSLCDKVEAEARRTTRKGKLTIGPDTTPFQVVSCVPQQQPAHEVSVQQQVLPPLLGSSPKIRVTKAERRVQQCIDAGSFTSLKKNNALHLRRKALDDSSMDSELPLQSPSSLQITLRV